MLCHTLTVPSSEPAHMHRQIDQHSVSERLIAKSDLNSRSCPQAAIVFSTILHLIELKSVWRGRNTQKQRKNTHFCPETSSTFVSDNTQEETKDTGFDSPCHQKA